MSERSDPARMRTALVAGASGAVGSVLVPVARAAGLRVIPHLRPRTAARHPLGKDPEALICDLADSGALDRAMARVDAVACLVGTMRRRFAQGDTYETSDYAPVIALIESAKRVPALSPRLFVLLSSLGAREGGGYTGWKWRAEEAVRLSGLPGCILRPSFLDSAGSGAMPSDGRARRPPPLIGGALRLLGAIPALRGFADDLRPMPIDVLARAIAKVLRDGAPAPSLWTGRQIWQAAQALPAT